MEREPHDFRLQSTEGESGFSYAKELIFKVAQGVANLVSPFGFSRDDTGQQRRRTSDKAAKEVIPDGTQPSVTAYPNQVLFTGGPDRRHRYDRRWYERREEDSTPSPPKDDNRKRSRRRAERRGSSLIPN
jgi:hypothetical protein